MNLFVVKNSGAFTVYEFSLGSILYNYTALIWKAQLLRRGLYQRCCQIDSHEEFEGLAFVGTEPIESIKIAISTTRKMIIITFFL